MNKLKTKYNVLAQSKLERLSLSTALLAIYQTLWPIKRRLMKSLLMLSIILLISTSTFGQKMDGVYEGLIEICHTDSMGVKTCFGDNLESNDKWYHLSYLKLDGDSVFLDMYPISITEVGDTLHSASDGGFYFYKGVFSGSDELNIELTEVYCDYCATQVKKINDNEYRPIKRKLRLQGKFLDGTLHINGRQFKRNNNNRLMESENFNPDK